MDLTKLQILFIIIISSILYICTFDVKINLSGDNVKYYLLGQSLANGTGYTNIWQQDESRHTHFPRGYPTIIALYMKLGIKSITGIKICNFIFFIGSLIIFFLFIQSISNNLVAFISTLLVGINSHLLYYSSIMMSEMMFMFFSVLTLYLTSKIDFSRQFYKNYYFLASLITLLISCFTRGIGVALMICIILYFLMLKQWKYAGISILISILFTLLNTGSQSSYLGAIKYKNIYKTELGLLSIQGYLDRISINSLRYILYEIPKTFLPFLNDNKIIIIGYLGGIIISILIFYSFLKLKKSRLLIIIFFICTLGILILWPEQWHGSRFLIPLFAFIIFFVVFGINQILISFRFNKNLTYLIIAIYLLFHIPTYWELFQAARGTYPVNWIKYIMVTDWAKSNTKKSDVFIARKESIFYLFSERKSYRYKFLLDDKKMIEDFCDKSVDYVVLDELGFSSNDRYLLPVIEKNPDNFYKVAQLKDTKTSIYQFKK